MELKGSTFIVTGGASGLGAATVRMVVAGGGNAVIADLKIAEGQALAAELANVDIVFHAFDFGGLATATDAVATYHRLRSSSPTVAGLLDAASALGLNWGIVDGN